MYKHWFVDFEFPNEQGLPYKSNGGEMVWNAVLEKDVPKDWEVEKLNSFLTVKYGKDHKHLKSGNIPLYGSGGIMRYVEKALYKEKSILIPRKGSLDNILFIDKPFWSVDTMFFTIIKNDYQSMYIYYYLKSIDFYALNVGSAVPSMTTKVLNDMDVISPNKDVLIKFENLLKRIYSFLKLRKEEIESSKKLISIFLSRIAKS